MGKSREELALMSKEELEVLVLHLQEDVTTTQECSAKAVRAKNELADKIQRIESRMNVLLELLNAWRETA